MHFRTKDIFRLKMKGKEYKKISHANGNWSKFRVAILIVYKIDFKIKIVARDEEGHYIMTNWSIKDHIIIVCVLI